MADGKHFHITPVAKSVPYDPLEDPDCDLTSENVQDVIDELCRRVTKSASPGYAWGRAGNLSSNVWLKNNEVSSQRSGLPIDLINGEVTSVFIGSENVDTFDITFYYHDGDSIGLTSLVTVSIVAARSGWFDVTDFGVVSIPVDKQLAARLTSGSAKNVQAFMVVKGEVA